MSEAKKRGRPRKVTDEEDRKELSIPKGYLEFIETIERYRVEAKWTKREFMSAIGLSDAQLYRYNRGESNIRKATVNRMAVELASKLDKEYGSFSNPYPATDAIDSLLNELLEKAGFTSSVKGKSGNDCWNRIAETKSWTLGFTSVPRWSIPPRSKNDNPTGLAIEFAEDIAKLLGINDTKWVHLNFDEMPKAILQRQVDAIAPFMVFLPGRLFDYSFSQKSGEDEFTLSAVTDRQLINGAENLEDLPEEKVELLYLKGELGDWGRKVLSQYRYKNFPEAHKAISYIAGVVERQEPIIPIFLIDNITGTSLIEEEEDLELTTLNIQSIKIKTYNAFAFHPDEKRLLKAVDEAIKMLPLIKSKSTKQG
jgi:ABC-type amino acid transport substrate-binding protein